jgi:arsenite oxidase small subunit
MPITRKEFAALSAAMALIPPLKPTLYLDPQLPFRAVKIANLRDLTVGHPIRFQYPDRRSPAILVKLGRPALGGVAPGQDVVAYSGICTHMGCHVAFRDGRFICPCHFSQYDPAKNGEVYQGLAVEYLPQIQLYLTSSDDILAEAIEGVNWGRISDKG